MFENVAAFVLAEHMGDRTFVPPRGGTGDARVLDPMGKPVRHQDGYICVSANTDAQAFALFNAIGRPELKADPRFGSVKRGSPMCAPISKRASRVSPNAPRPNGLKILEDADVPAGRMHSLEGVMADEHLADVKFFRGTDHPVENRIIDIACPNSFSAGSREQYLPAPLIGGDSIEILREIGYRDSEIDEMISDGIAIDGRQSASGAASIDRARGAVRVSRGNSDKGS